MRNTLTYRRRAATGLAAMSAGAALLVAGIAGPASAHGEKEPEKPTAPVDKSCVELADFYDVDQEWSEYKITELPEDGVETDFTIDDRGTEDTGDDAIVRIKITDEGAILEWWSTIGIDAVYVNGTNAEKGSYFYLYAPNAEDEEATHDFHLGVPPWGQAHKNTIKSVSFCYDEDSKPPETTVPPTSSSVPEETTTSVPEETTTTVEETTTTTAPASTTEAPTTAPPTTETPEGGLPQTGSNTGLLVAVGAGLLAVGGVLVASKRQIWRRFAS
jgi:LPXTG-motif cell wall-anchored protein